MMGGGGWGCPESAGTGAPHAGRNAPQFQRVPAGRPDSEPPGSKRHSHSLPSTHATMPSRAGVQLGGVDAAPTPAERTRNGRGQKRIMPGMVPGMA